MLDEGPPYYTQMTKKKVYWIFQLFGWSAYGLFNVLIYRYSSGEMTALDSAGVWLQTAFYILSTHIFRWFLKRKRWITFSSLKLVPLLLLSNVVMGVANYLFLLGYAFLVGTLVVSIEFRTINMTLGVLGPAAMYFLWSLIYLTYHYFEQYNKSLKYEAVLRDTELNYLRSQLNPHFIFNALNSIRALVDENPMRSKEAITQLSGIMRSSLQSNKHKLVSLEEEIQIVRDYLSLESIRFEERLEVKIEMNEHTRYFKIPPMMIQTLVENGIKHGISQRKEGGFIEVKTYLESDFLFIQIRNTGVYLAGESVDDKYGLSNTHKRLDLLFEGTAGLEISNEKEGVVLTQIRLPRYPRNDKL